MLNYNRSEKMKNFLFKLELKYKCNIDEQIISAEWDNVQDSFNNSEYEKKLKEKLAYFIKELYDDSIPLFYKQNKLYEFIDYDWIDDISNYVLSTYLASENAYYNFEVFIHELTKKLLPNIFNEINFYELQNRIFETLHMSFDIYTNRNKVLLPEYNSLYERICNKLELEPVNFNDKNEFYIWSEREALKKEQQENPSNEVIWISRDNGDGYGYDILSYNPFQKCEKLIEVKSGITPQIQLTEYEKRVFLQSLEYPNSEYVIYKYVKLLYDNIAELYTYHFNKEKNTFFCNNGFEYEIRGNTLIPTEECIQKVFRKFNSNQ